MERKTNFYLFVRMVNIQQSASARWHFAMVVWFFKMGIVIHCCGKTMNGAQKCNRNELDLKIYANCILSQIDVFHANFTISMRKCHSNLHSIGVRKCWIRNWVQVYLVFGSSNDEMDLFFLAQHIVISLIVAINWAQSSNPTELNATYKQKKNKP